MTDGSPTKLNPQKIVDQLYDIALDPKSLDDFIDAWNDAGLDASAARQTIKDIDQFDHAFQAHLKRADTFLSRESTANDGPDFTAILTPFDTLAAFVVDQNQKIVATNAGATQAFSINEGGSLDQLSLPSDTFDAVMNAFQAVLGSTESPDHILKVDLLGQRGPALFQFRKLQKPVGGVSEHVLIVTTRYHWHAALGQTLEEVFGLTSAEQYVVRALVEGMDAKTIASERGTSEGTVRGQIKSILAKMNARTQSEVIRLVVSLRDVSKGAEPTTAPEHNAQANVASDWLQAEVWKPFKTLMMPDGRRLDYHDMGPITGAPVLYSHMGFCLVRWHEPMLRLAFAAGLRIICPIRAGYGHSDNLDPKADVLATTRSDTLTLLKHLDISRLPYLTQGNDLIFAADLAAHHPDMVSEIIGICARPCLPGDKHYSGMAKWHRFFLSTAKHAPHLLKFTARAAISMAKRIGVEEMFRQMNQSSAADLALLEDEQLIGVLSANGELVVGKDTNIAQAYAMEILATEADWSDLMLSCKTTRTWFVNGAQDPSTDVATIAEYREAYPWIDIDVIANAGQLLIYQHFETLIPKIAEAARAARDQA